MAAVSKSVVFSNVLEVNAPNGNLDPLSLSVMFDGIVPPESLTFPIPIQISVTLPSEFAVHTTPHISTDNTNLLGRPQQSMSSDTTPPSTKSYFLPFLPLPPDFDFLNELSWKELAQCIQDWFILQLPPEFVRVRAWALDLFWVTFIAAHPLFPSGDWPTWDQRIPMAGPFISTWNARDGFYSEIKDIDLPKCDEFYAQSRESKIRYRLWRLFTEMVQTKFPKKSIIGRI